MNEAKKKANEFIKVLNKSGIEVYRAFLFGSYARGKAKKDSDIDVCVVSRSFGKDYLKEMVKLRRLSLGIDSRIEPVPFSLADFNDKRSILAAEVKKYGIPLFW